MKVSLFLLVFISSLNLYAGSSVEIFKTLRVANLPFNDIEGNDQRATAAKIAEKIYTEMGCGFVVFNYAKGESMPVSHTLTCPLEYAEAIANRFNIYVPTWTNLYRLDLALTNKAGLKKYFLFNNVGSEKPGQSKLVWAADPSRELSKADILNFLNSTHTE